MSISIREATGKEVEALIPLLLLAEPQESALRWSLKNLSDTAYRLDEDDELVGAATMRWQKAPCEIVELAIAPEQQGKGLGRQFIQWLVAEGRRRGKSEILVGTANASIDNIAFYQKCGFRMHEVRRDYFWYHREPVFENGIQVRDMIVFRYDLTEPDAGKRDTVTRRRGEGKERR
ncbi:MAG: GNAT family N-acetyltransferase [Blastocatellia bacterium]